MKKFLWLILLLGVAGKNSVMAQIASFSFSGAPTTVSGWTNLPGDPYSGAQVATMSGITISSISPANWVPNSVPSNVYNFGGASNASYFPAAVMANTWLQWNGNSNNLALYNASVPQLLLSGLNPDSTYILRMSGSDVFYQGPTQYTVAGASVSGSQNLTTYNNTTQGVTFTGIRPNASGQIKVYVNATSTSTFAFISGLQVFAGNAVNVGTPVVALTAPGNGTIQSEGGNFTITATASETGGSIAKVEFYADTTKIGEADTAPFTMTWVDPDPGDYQVTAKATDAIGTIATASVNVGVQSLNYFWSTTGNAKTGGDTSFVGTVDSNRLAFRTKNIERMTISAIGNVGIGTDSPTAALDVVSTNTGVLLPRLTNAQRNGIVSGDLHNGLLLYNTDSSVFQYYNGNSWNSVGSGAGGTSTHWSYSGGAAFDSLDNIGIGTSNTQGYKLAVNGSAIVTRIVVKPQNAWPDYVFKKEYRLPGLDSLERYIREQHHLPGFASATEVSRNGIDVGEQQTLLLQKLEENSLYLIDQNKQLNEENAQLKAQQETLMRLASQVADLDKEVKRLEQENAILRKKQPQP